MIFEFCYCSVCTYVSDLFNMTTHFGDSSHVHTCYVKQPLFRVTSLMDNSSCKCYSMLVIYIHCKVQIQEGNQANIQINLYVLEIICWGQGYYKTNSTEPKKIEE